MPLTKRKFVISGLFSPLFLAGCLSDSETKFDVNGNVAFTNSSGETVEITVWIIDRENWRRIWKDSFQLASSDDGAIRQGVVTSFGSYDVEATIEGPDEVASTVWRLQSEDRDSYYTEDGVVYYTIRVHVKSDGSLEIVGDGV